MSESIGIGHLLVSFADYGEGGQPFSKGKDHASVDVEAENVINKSCGGERCIGLGDWQVGSVCPFGKEGTDDGVLMRPGTVYEGSVDLMQVHLIGNITQVEDKLSEGWPMLVSKSLDGSIMVVVNHCLVCLDHHISLTSPLLWMSMQA